jgi:hypothetical protein
VAVTHKRRLHNAWHAQYTGSVRMRPLRPTSLCYVTRIDFIMWCLVQYFSCILKSHSLAVRRTARVRTTAKPRHMSRMVQASNRTDLENGTTMCVQYFRLGITSRHLEDMNGRMRSRYSDQLRAGRHRGQSSSPGRVKNFLWGPPSLLSSGNRVLFPGGKGTVAWSWPLSPN